MSARRRAAESKSRRQRRVEDQLRPLGEALVTLRRKADLHRNDVAEAAGMSRAQVANYERGRRWPKLATVLRYLDAVGADLHDLAVVMRYRGRRFGEHIEEMLELATAIRGLLTSEIRDAVAEKLDHDLGRRAIEEGPRASKPHRRRPLSVSR